MVHIDKFLKLSVPKPDVNFISSLGIGTDILYIPESGNLKTFFKNDKINIVAKTEGIYVPPRLNISGKNIITNKYFTELKKDKPNTNVLKMPTRVKIRNKNRFFDIGSVVNQVMELSNLKSAVGVFDSFFQRIADLNYEFIESEKKLTKLEETERKKIILLDVNLSNQRIYFAEQFEYYLSLRKYRLFDNVGVNHIPEALIFKVGNVYYNIGKKVMEKDTATMQINRPLFNKVMSIIKNINSETTMKELKSISSKETKLTYKLLGYNEKITLDEVFDLNEKIKEISDNEKNQDELLTRLRDLLITAPAAEHLIGKTPIDKLKNFYLALRNAEKIKELEINALKDKSIKEITKSSEASISADDQTEVTKEVKEAGISEEKEKEIQELKVIEQKLNKEYHGTVLLEEMQERSNFGLRSYNPDNILNLTEFSGYKKQGRELSSNLDKNIKDLVLSVEKDQEMGITVHKVSTKIVDDNATRYKEFTVQLSHPNFGSTYKKKYPVKFRVPIPIEEKYIKFGGNNYIMVNQLFNKPLQKIDWSLVRLFTHYNTTSVILKRAKFNAHSGHQEIEKDFLVTTRKIPKTKVIAEEIDTPTRELLEGRGIPLNIIAKLRYKKIHLTSPIQKNGETHYVNFLIDFSEIERDDDIVHNPFMRVSISKDKKMTSMETTKEDRSISESYYLDSTRITMHSEDTNDYPLEQLDELILGQYNRISKLIADQDIIKKSKSSVPYFETKINGKLVPVAVLLVMELGWEQALKKLNIKWTIQQNKVKSDKTEQGIGGEPLNIPCLKAGKRYYVTVYPKTLKQKYLAHGFLNSKWSLKSSEFSPLGDLYESHAHREMGEVGYFKYRESIPKIVDNTTAKILAESNKPTNVLELYSETMPNMLMSADNPMVESLENYRIRMSETISHIGYKLLQQALSELKRKKNYPDEKLFIKPNFIMNELLGAGIFQAAKTINPIEELMLTQKVIKTGIGNVKKDQVTLTRRDLNPSYFGVISPTATNEYAGIGSNQTLTNGTKITDQFGSIKTKKYNNEDNPFNMLSPVESCTPFYEYDDTTRRVMGNQQTGQFTQLNNPDEPPVQTGFEEYVPHLVSDRFSKKAKIHGKVTLDPNNDQVLIIKGQGPDAGKTQRISLEHSKARTKRGVYLLNEYTHLVSEGQKVKPGTIVAATSSLKSGKLAVGKNLIIAEMGYNGKNYEDGWVITNKLKSLYENKYLQKILIMVPKDIEILDSSLTVGSNTEAGDILFSFTKRDYIMSDTYMDDENDDVMYGLEQRGKQTKYFSPGGVIKEIVVKLNSNSAHKKIINLWNKSTKSIKDTKNACQLLTKDMDPEEKQQAYLECMGNAENIETLKVGGHKVNGMEPEWAIIEVYIERNNPINNGSKFTLTNSGGKGTVQHIIPKGQEPKTVETNLTIDFIPTSLSIIKRKNPSIYLSMYLGKCIYFLNEKIKNMPLAKAKKLLLDAYTITDKTPDKRILNELSKVINGPQDKLQKLINMSSLSRPSFPAIVPPFMNKIKMRDIVEFAKLLDIPLKEKIYIPENDGTMTLKKVPVGILPVYLLEHFPGSQGSVRGSQYVKNSIVTGQGDSGTKDRKGATKVGLYDNYSLLTKRPYGLLKELHSLRSDSGRAKEKYHAKILRGEGIPSIKDIEITKDDTKTKNYIEALLLGAGLKAYY